MRYEPSLPVVQSVGDRARNSSVNVITSFRDDGPRNGYKSVRLHTTVQSSLHILKRA